MDVFLFIMGATLFVAGWFLFWDYVRCLSSVYRVKGSIVAFESAFSKLARGSVNYFPVIQYRWRGEAVRFTSICSHVDELRLGDPVDMRFSLSRRRRTRLGRSSITLMLMLALLCAVFFTGAVLANVSISVYHVGLASLIVTFCLFVISLYLKEQDESGTDITESQSDYSLSLFEPSAFKHWTNLSGDAHKKVSVFGARLFGAMCFSVGLTLAAGSFLVVEGPVAKSVATHYPFLRLEQVGGIIQR
ncbi:hypothetical protein OLMES_4585 [Oleiphilus messinensis]|uniref:DUF3592 domain-containing protein n=1 Tax=Oleiphilus messinensis TaxID=141451 RepID=A0A1Y0IDR1_9GAMM|nr:DUF3592 domain-containing protein [Oleiphilus messinensis]ARU58581.1 hypothetical protein OLMES_4585 [Oleiphilus messinensis]